MLSLCLIIKNEEKWLPDLLDSWAAWPVEWVFVDTGSTDSSLSILESKGISWHSFDWIDDFSAARNFGLSKAKGEWIFIIDPDERIAPQDQEKIFNLTNVGDKQVAFRFATRNYTQDSHRVGFKANAGDYPEFEKNYSGYTLSKKARLFRNHCGIHFSGVVHELVEPSLMKTSPTTRIVESPIPIHHYGARDESEESRKKLALYLRQLEMKVSGSPNDWIPLYQMGVHLLEAGEFQNAANAFKAASLLQPPYGPLYSQWAAALLAMNQRNLALQTLENGVKIDPENPDILFNLGVFYFDARDWSRARQHFQLSYQHLPQASALQATAKTFLQEGKFQEAADCLLKAAQEFPKLPEVKVDLAAILFAAGKKAEAKQLVEAALQVRPDFKPALKLKTALGSVS